ncbi:uncharacterized protein LOC120343806 isoform X2 [Styela clava]
MDSIDEYDPTLPLDLNNTSVNITRFHDASSIGEASVMSDPGHAQASSANLLTMSDDRTSPLVNRSMKDYSTQISELKKENFGLKLRIFYMEERMQQQFTGDHEHIYQSNIELKVECDSLRKELQDKHGLLVKATNAVASMEAGPEEIRRAQETAQKELQQVKDAMHERVQEADRELREVRAEADSLSENVRKLQDYAHKLEKDNDKLKQDLDHANIELERVKESLPYEEDNEQNSLSTPGPAELNLLQEDLQNKEKLIDQLRQTLEVKQTMLEALNDEKQSEENNLQECNDAINDLENKNKELENEVFKTKQQDERLRSEYMTYIELQHEYQQHISEQQQRLDEFELAARQMSEELEKREEEVQDLTAALKDAEETGRELADSYDQLKSEKDSQKTKELLMRDKAISGLTEVIRKKDDEITNLKSDISRRESRLEELTSTISTLNAQEDSVDDRLKRLRELERELQELKNRNMDLDIQNQKLNSQLESNEELVRTLDENLKEKDKNMQELVNKYKELLKKQQDDEQTKDKIFKEQEEMMKTFEKEKKEFAEMMNNTKRQLEECAQDAEDINKSQEISRLQEKIDNLESHLRSKHLQLEDATNLFKKAENERKTTLNELEEAMKRRDAEQKREMESRNRINAAKTAEIERLREEIRVKEDRLQNLEDDLLQLDRTAHEARDKAVLSGREAARWKEDSARKDVVIAELTESLEALGNSATNTNQKQIIKLTRENAELKQLLKAREAELSFLQNEQNADDPYIDSLKREIARKDKIIADERQLQDSLHNAFVTWSKISEDTSSMNAVLDSLRIDLENHKKELNNAKNMINTLTSELENSHQQILALHKACDAKDRVIQDLKASRRFPTVESEEGSSTTTENMGRSKDSPHRQQRFTKRKSKHHKRGDNFSIHSSSTNTGLKFTDDDELDFLSSENGVANDHHGLRIKEELKNEIQQLHLEIEALKGVHRDEQNAKEIMEKVEKQKEYLKRLSDILSEEQKIYKKQLNLNSKTGSSHASHSESEDGTDSVKYKRRLERRLKEISNLRNRLKTLLLDVSNTEDVSIQANDNLHQSVSSTIFPMNQTSYMEIPPVLDTSNLTLVSNHSNADDQEKFINDLQIELEKTRAELRDAIRELADLRSIDHNINTLRDQLEDKSKEISLLQQKLDAVVKEGEMKDSEMSSLRIEVDRLRALQLKIGRDSDTDNARSICSGDESDGMGALSRRELREFIGNLKKKLQNAEKLNELLGDQLESTPKRPDSSAGYIDPNLTSYLSSEVERLKQQLRDAQEELKDEQDQTRRKSEEHGRASRSSSRSKLPVPVERTQKPKDVPTSPTKKEKPESTAAMKAKCEQLQSKLAATEETVRHQTEKLKRAKAAMASAGISDPMLSPVRAARSHPNLLFGADSPNRETSPRKGVLKSPSTNRTNGSDTHTQTSADDTGYASISPRSEQKYNSLIQAQAKELSALRQQLKKSREICKDLRTEYDIVHRYIKSLLQSAAGQSDEMLAASVTNELDRCKQLTRRLKEQLSEWTSDGSLSSDSDESTTSRGMSVAERQASQLIQKNQELDTKNRQIKDLEERVSDLLRVKHDIDSQTHFHKFGKGQKISLDHLGYLTPTSSRHSIYTNPEEEFTAPTLRPTISQNTEYVPLPDRRSPRFQPADESYQSSPRLNRSLPMYQRTIAVTEYLPPTNNGHTDYQPGRRRLPTTNDAECCTASYGGSWVVAASPRKQDTSRLSFNPDPVVYSSPSHHENQQNVESLKRKLDDSKRLNESLKEELDLTNEALKQAKYSSNRGQTGRNPADILEEHLSEIRTLRQHLENSIETNDRLREQLERKLKNTTSRKNGAEHISANIYLPAESQDNEKYEQEIKGLREQLARAKEQQTKLQNQLEAEISMKNNFAAASKELEQLRMRLVESSTQTELLGSYIDNMNSSIAEKEVENEKLKNLLLEQEDEIKQLKDENEINQIETDTLRRDSVSATESTNQMREDLNRLNEELDESHHLVRSLKSELALYEKFHKNKDAYRTPQKSGSNQEFQGRPLDISEFLAEIKILRVQLERSIEANAALRKQLQEQLKHKENGNSTPGKSTTINIHHLPASTPVGRVDDDVFDRNSPPDSGRSGSRRKLKMGNDEKPSTFLMTPPPSASSCGEDQTLGGFEFASLPPQMSTGTRFPKRNEKQQNWPHYNMHGPYILGKLSDYNELKQVTTDSRLLVRNMELKATGRSVPSALTPSKGTRKQRSPSSSHVDENLQLLHRMLEDSGRILKLFWPASIPPPSLQLPLSGDSENRCQKCASRQSDASLSDVSKCTRDAGFASDSSINSEADGLRREVSKLHKRLSAQDKLLQSTVDRLQTANRMKEGIEHAILKQLTVTHDVLKKARGNLEAKAGESRTKESHQTVS